MPTKVLVAGGGGYIGSVLCEQLLKRGYAVRVLDRFFFGAGYVPAQPSLHYEKIEGDTRTIGDSIFAGVSAVVDLAGISNDASCALNPKLTQSINRDGGLHLAAGAKRVGVPRYIYASSCSVYGAGEDHLLTESAPCRPLSYYSKSKLEVEEQLLHFYASDSFCVTALRNGTVYGPSPRMRFDLIVNVMAARAVQDQKIFINGGGNQWRPLVHVRDVAAAYIAALEAPREKVAKQIFNVGGTNYRVTEIAEKIHESVPGSQVILVPEDVDPRSYRVDCQKIQERLGFSPSESLVPGIQEIAESVRQGRLRFTATPDDPTCTTLRYQELLRDNPMLSEPAASPAPGAPKANIEFSRHNLDEMDIARASDTLRSLFLTTGKQTALFEKRFADFLGVKRVVGTSSCTQSLFLVLKALEIKEGDEVIVPALTFFATANAVLHAGARPVFVDSDPSTGNMDPFLVEKAITSRTKAIIPVHLYGHLCEMEALSAIAKKYRLQLIEDAAHCIEGSKNGVKPGALSRAACFSFYATKNITCGEGGAIATNDEALADHLQRLRLHGMASGAAQRYSGPTFRHFDMETLGFKANMPDISASLLLGQLTRIDSLLERREAIAQAYGQALSSLPYFKRPAVLPQTKHARHLFTIWVPSQHRDAIVQHLKQEGIGVAVNYRPVHLSNYYSAHFGYRRGNFPVAEAIGDSTISIPIYPQLKDSEVQTVIEALRAIPRLFPQS